ncbi:dTDP-4-dehydrorhamnose 3,5-epimerase [Aliihoeflea aestuarii]|uniref:dTDP-4-dehydrorhamnose 3,5-epimerase n=1 Tax=Aliihoeflea aestuarii TaxID=453840 RepID=UPI0020945DE6|nr:dTDP-4-dehydrorhamnose 3,5-epimerase [Aliihoeflea aestuarii]MCO6392326.1 dTDP-4-dehydrorhamnose 3,5-epimerase [Aliihoeflea aestuarii]
MSEIRQLALPGVVEIVPKRFQDDRGFFSETYSERDLPNVRFVQDNHSRSTLPGTVRGLHYQIGAMAQDKLVRVVRGAIFDVAVDIRRSSPTAGQWVGLTVSAKKWNQIFVPKGFAHGFMTLEPDTEVIYKVSAPYAPEAERSIRFDDPDIAIDWPEPAGEIILSDKDARAASFQAAEMFE